MANASTGENDANRAVELLRDILITQLAFGGVPQQSIRKILGCDINRVSRIVKHLKNATSRSGRDTRKD
jgi:hypothetical protein